MRTLFLASVLFVGLLQPALADAPRTFWGKTVEGWISVFRDKASTDVQRRQAVWALGCFGAEAKAAVPDLIDAVHNRQLTDEAVKALSQIGAGAEVTVPILIQQLLKWGQNRAENGAIGFSPYNIEDSLVRIGGPAVPALRDILNDPNEAIRVHAARILARIGPAAKPALPSLIRMLVHRDHKPESEFFLKYIIRTLGRIGPDAKAAVPALIELGVEDGYDFDLVLALDRIGAPPIRQLADEFNRVPDSSAIELLAWLGPKAQEAIPSLRATLTNSGLQGRIWTAAALAQIEPSPTESISVLIDAFTQTVDRDLDRFGMPSALTQLGPSAKEALPALINLVRKGYEDAYLLEALVRIDPEGTQCVPALIGALKSEDGEYVDVAARCLGLLGPRANDAVSALASVACHEFRNVFPFNPAVSAAKALRRIGPAAIPALIPVLKHRPKAEDEGIPDDSAAVAAAQVLGSFGGEAKAAVPALIEAIWSREKDDANGFVRQAAILALGRIRRERKTVIPVLRDMMQENGGKSNFLPELVIALYQLAPDGKELAEQWLQKPMSNRFSPGMTRLLEGRAMVLGTMGRPSVEADSLTRYYLERIDEIIANTDPSSDYQFEGLEGWIEKVGQLGIGAKSAFPRLNDLRKNHSHPWVRMWAAEALERITPHTPTKVN